MGPEEVRVGINDFSSNSICFKFVSATVFNSVSVKGYWGFRCFISAPVVMASILVTFICAVCAKAEIVRKLSTELDP